jgi:hypothetical protein
MEIIGITYHAGILTIISFEKSKATNLLLMTTAL